jgi:serine/threonine protein phosphatase PrpC
MSSAIQIKAATGLHKGDRDYQQDQVLIVPHARVEGCLLGVIADGMGGRSGGRKASDQVMMTARQLFERYNPATDDAAVFLRSIATQAHLVIKLTAIAAEQEPHSTIAALVINPGGDCHWIHSGDSRIYHFRHGKLMHRTTDHSYVQGLVDRGEISEEQANKHPNANILLGCLGTEADPPLAVHTVSQLQPGDVVMACSDGVWHYFNNDELGAILAALPPPEAAKILIDKARTRACAGGDNLSLAIIGIAALDE